MTITNLTRRTALAGGHGATARTRNPDAIRTRAKFAGQAFGLNSPTVRRVTKSRLDLHTSEDAMAVVEFCGENGFSIDWLVSGDFCPAAPRVSRDCVCYPTADTGPRLRAGALYFGTKH